FVNEIVAIYPEAKIILATRSAESWHRSMMSTIYPARHHGFVYTTYHKLFKTRYGLIEKMFNIFWEYFFHDNFPNMGNRCTTPTTSTSEPLLPKIGFWNSGSVMGESLCVSY
ncbi:hypothetical protein DL95DRAFT_296006, partial [Leptodontidium sp. 2 PMI_412]